MRLKRLIIASSRLLPKRKHRRLISAFLHDLIKSSFITIVIYYLAFIFFNFLFTVTSVCDPSLKSIRSALTKSCNIKTNQQSATSNNLAINSNTQLMLLAGVANSSLSKAQLKPFLCYRTLFDILRVQPQYQHDRVMDLCVFDEKLSSLGVRENFLNLFFSDQLDNELKAHQQHLKFDYTYNSIYGFYQLTIGQSNLFIYKFMSSPETQLEFETIRRHGVIFNQFFKLNEDNTLGFSLIGKFMRDNEVNMPIRIPIYMVSRMSNHVDIWGGYFSLPNDPDLMLVYFYPESWYLSAQFNKCFI